MLKGRSKIFAPKKGGSRKLSAPPSSGRPSVERQSQTPAPSQPTRDSIPPIPEGTETSEPVAPSISQNAEKTSSQQAEREGNDESPLRTIESPKIVPSISHTKRKAREDEGFQPPTKRIPIEAAGKQIPTPLPTQSRSTSSLNIVENYTAAPETSRTPTVVNSQRKPREASVAHPPARRASPGLSRLVGQTPSDEHPQTKAALADSGTERQRSLVPSVEVDLPISVERTRANTRRVTFQEPTSEPQPGPTPNATQVERAALRIQRVPIETNHDDASRSQSLERDATPEAPRYRYPSPENIVRIAGEIPVMSNISANMGPAGASTSGLGAAGDIGGQVRIRSAHTSEVVPRATLNPDGTSGGVVEESASGTETGTEKGKKKRKYTKRKKILKDGDLVRATIDMQIARPRRQPAKKRSRKKKDKEEQRKVRDETPEGASDEEIDVSTLTMTDLCKDLKIGKKFSMHNEIKQRIVKKKLEVARAKMVRENPDLEHLIVRDDGIAAPAGSAEAGPSGTNGEEESPEPESSARGPQMRIVDGVVVLDDQSLLLDRRKRAAENEEIVEAVEENDFTRVITSGTYMKRERAQLWDHPANDLFYKGLRMFGTDFEMIAKLFPHRNRRQIKLKFNREEKVNAVRINRALTGQKEAIDLDEFRKFSNMELEEVDAIEAERKRIEAEQNAELEKHAEAAAEVTRKKKEAIQSGSAAARRLLATAASDDDEPTVTGREGDSAKENTEPGGTGAGSGTSRGKGKKKAVPKKPKKTKNSMYGGGGEEVEVLGTID